MIRDALSEMERAGYIERVRGIGTVVNRTVLGLRSRLDQKLEYYPLISCSNFSRFFALPVSGSEAVSIRSFFREGRRASASSSFFSTRSALRLAWVSFLSAASGGSSSAVNSSLEGRFGSPSAEPGCFSWGSSAFAASWKRCWYLLPC